jgi:molybdopterin-binding protein
VIGGRAQPPIAGEISAVVANDAVSEPQFPAGKSAFARIKASRLILGVAA